MLVLQDNKRLYLKKLDLGLRSDHDHERQTIKKELFYSKTNIDHTLTHGSKDKESSSQQHPRTQRSMARRVDCIVNRFSRRINSVIGGQD